MSQGPGFHEYLVQDSPQKARTLENIDSININNKSRFRIIGGTAVSTPALLPSQIVQNMMKHNQRPLFESN